MDRVSPESTFDRIAERIEHEHEAPHAAGNLMDSKTSHLDDRLNNRLEEAYDLETSTAQHHEIARISLEFSPIDLAYGVCRLPGPVRVAVYDSLPDWDSRAEFVTNTNRETRLLVFRHLNDGGLRDLIEHMPTDDAVFALEHLPERRLRRLFEALEPQKAANIRELAQHELRSAGRMMTNEYFACPMEMTIGEAAAQIREHPEIDFSRQIFVVNAAGELQGFVPARNLIINPIDASLRQVMQPIHHKVSPESSRDEVVDLVERYKVSALPVVSGGSLVGVITYEDVVEAVEDIADETIGQMAGTLEKVSEHDPIIKRFFSRAPWLVVTLCGGLINAASIAYFQTTLHPWLAFIIFFVPLITGMSGNVGVQCSTVLVRGMAIGVLSSGSRREAVTNEISIGLLTGVVFGLLCGVAVYLLNVFGIQEMGVNPLAVGVIVSTGLLSACMTATLLGVFLPLFFARVGVDPAVAAGPMVTAVNDVLSMVIYFVVAQAVSTTFF